MALTYKDTGTVGTPSKIEVRSEVGRLVGMILKPPDGPFQFFRDVLALPINPTHADADLNRLKQWLETHRDQISG